MLIAIRNATANATQINARREARTPPTPMVPTVFLLSSSDECWKSKMKRE
jgi:hypothetical protein